MRVLRQALVALVVFVVVAAAAAAGGGNALRVSGEGWLFPYTMDPAEVAELCPAGHTWIVVLQGYGAGSLTSEAYTGDVAWSGRHCTRLVVERPGHITIGKTASLFMTFVTPEGELTIEHQGGFVLKGTFPVDYRTDGTASYTVTDGTGVFAGATGHGHMDVVDSQDGFAFTLNGSLKLAG